MTEQGGTSQRVTVAEAAGILGVSVVTVRRMLKRGQLEGERVHRAQGSAYVVTLPPDALAGVTDGTATGQPAQNVSRPDGTPAGLMAVWSETFLAPIMARMAEQETTIRDQAETIGRQGAELEAERRARQQFVSEQDASELSRQHDRRRLLVTVAVLVAVALVAGTLAVAGWGL